jgi:glycosyltransferase involved in cell wall biosynthesis
MTKYRPGVTVVIPTIPPRKALLNRAAESVSAASTRLKEAQLSAPVELITVGDERREGAARTRHRGLMEVDTEWVAFLDDDDVMLSDHFVRLYGAALTNPRCPDYLWSRFVIKYPNGSELAGPAFLGEKAFSQWDDADPCQTTITTMVRTELARDAGGFLQFEEGEQIDGQRRGEDFEFTTRCRVAGGEFLHVPFVTWEWWHWGGNTSGLPTW